MDSQEYLKGIGAKIRAARKAQNLSQPMLAELLESSDYHISKIEQGHKAPNVLMLKRIADALNIRPKDLL